MIWCKTSTSASSLAQKILSLLIHSSLNLSYCYYTFFDEFLLWYLDEKPLLPHWWNLLIICPHTFCISWWSFFIETLSLAFINSARFLTDPWLLHLKWLAQHCLCFFCTGWPKKNYSSLTLDKNIKELLLLHNGYFI